ncbi:MAG: flagellar brake protein [Gammaproteobacteria bacterium]|nr:flagellar brake protein [Gammaproteobacteria bacterium]MDH5776579.1 flagellar brake protein [Gammaproteobacteria bacterium]
MNRQPFQIHTRPQILALLIKIVENKSLLTIKIEGEDGSYSSSILSINARKNNFALDEPFPQTYEHLDKNTILHCYTRLDGISISFSCKTEARSKFNGGYVYQLSLPTTINHHQRRRHYRIPLNWVNASLNINSPEKRIDQAIVTDISLSGIGASIPANFANLLQKNSMLNQNILMIANFSPIQIDLEIRSIRADSPNAPVCIGAQFVNLQKSQKEAIQQLIAQLNRETCQIKALARYN